MPKMINWIKIIPLAIFLLLITLAFSALENDNSESIPSAYIGKKPPALILTPLGDLPRVTEEDLQPTDNVQIILVNFWSSWCPPCRAEHPQLEKFSTMTNVKIIGVNYKDNPEKTIKWLKDLGNPYKNILIDKDGKISIDWGVYGIPETFIVNSNGIIKYRHVGAITNETYKKINSIIKQNE